MVGYFSGDGCVKCLTILSITTASDPTHRINHPSVFTFCSFCGLINVIIRKARRNVSKLDIGGKKLFEFLKANYDVPEYVTGFTIDVEVGRTTKVIWKSHLTEKNETENITESLKDATESTE